MTVSNQTSRTSAVGTGAEQTVPFTFPITNNSDIVVTQRVTATGVETTLAETTNYTVTNNGESGGSITTVSPFVASTAQIHIVRNTPDTQLLDLVAGGAFSAENNEDAYDKLTRLSIEKQDGLDRTLKFPTTDPASSFADMPNSIDRANKNLTFDVNGKPTASVSDISGSVSHSTLGENIAGAANALTVRGLIELDTTDDVQFAAITGTTGTFSGAVSGTTGTLTDIVTKLPIVDVRAFGAVIDGATNDTTAIQNSIDSITKGMVFIPEGTAISTNTKIKNKLILTGVGVESSILKLSGVGTLVTSDLTNNSYCGIRDMSLKGDFATSGTKLMDITGPYESCFDRVHFAGADNLLKLSEIEGATTFNNCIFYNAASGGFCITLDNVMDVAFNDCLVNHSEAGFYITRTNSRTRQKFSNIASEQVGRLFFVDAETQAGIIHFSDINAWDVGSNLADATTGYGFRIGTTTNGGPMCEFENIQVNVINAATPIIKTENWSILAKDCPSGANASDDLIAYIPRFSVGWGGSYIASSKRSILDTDVSAASLYTASGSVSVSTASGYGEYTSTGTGQARIRPLTTGDIANKMVMIRFEYKSVTASTPVMNISSMGGLISGYSGSTVNRSLQTIALPTTADVWTKCYLYTRYTAEYDQSSRYYLLELQNGDTLDIRDFEIFECDRPPYNLLDW
jgi:hypothetical protein